MTEVVEETKIMSGEEEEKEKDEEGEEGDEGSEEESSEEIEGEIQDKVGDMSHLPDHKSSVAALSLYTLNQLPTEPEEIDLFLAIDRDEASAIQVCGAQHHGLLLVWMLGCCRCC